MEKNYIIDVFSDKIVDGERDTYQITTHADLENIKSGWVITYTEEDEQGSLSKTEITYNENTLTVIRQSAELTTHLMLQKGVRHVSHHNTPYGSFSMGINAEVIICDLTEQGGRLFFKYFTDIELAPLGEMSFDINLRKKHTD